MKGHALTVVCLFLSSLFILVGCQVFAKEAGYSLDEVYQYPVVPGMEAWKALESLPEMAQACQIPEEILGELTTEALLETIKNYPLALNVFAYEDRRLGLEHVKDYFNGLDELYSRKEALAKTEAFLEVLPDSQDMPEKAAKMFIEIILEDLREKSD